jgi:enoyl-CoA hydratase/carnithine racemase
VLKDIFDDIRLVDEANDAHFSLAFGAGKGIGLEMILTGKKWDAKRAMEVGLINRVVPHAELHEAAWEWGAEISRWDRITLAYCKMAVHAAMEAPSVPLAAEIVWLMQQEHTVVNPKSYEGMRAFLGKKGPKAF